MNTAGQRHAADERGAALLIVLFMIVVLGLTVGVAGSTWKSVSQRAREAELFWRGDQYRQAIASYFEARQGKGAGMFPQKLDDLVQDPRFPGAVRHIRRLYNDPMTGGEWVLIKDPGGRITGVRSDSDLEPFRKDGFPAEYEAFRDSASYRNWEFKYEPKSRKTAPVNRKVTEEKP